jgi:hypothetical protein
VLPFMSRFLVVLAIGFFFISTVDMYEVRNFVKTESSQSIRVKIEELLRATGNQPATGVDVVQQGLLLLEAEALDKRYRQASALLMSRIWTRPFIMRLRLRSNPVLSVLKLSAADSRIVTFCAER